MVFQQKIETNGGVMGGYMPSVPEGESRPGLVIIQEIFGVNKVMRDLTDSWAEKGYTTICPDLFWRFKPGIDITDQTQEEWDQAFGYYQAFDEDKGTDDIKATIDMLRQHPSCNGKVGAIGFCLGGKLAFLTATRTDVNATVSYYGVGIEQNIIETSYVTSPLMLHIAEEDEYVPHDAQGTILAAALAHKSLVSAHVYPSVNHAFARIGGGHYHEESASLANQRTEDFLAILSKV